MTYLGITVEVKLGDRIGDSIVVTQMEFEYLTDHPPELLMV
jgi:Xaa-Pro aminopeptidase